MTDIQRLLAAIKRGETFERVCNVLDMSPKRVERLIVHARKAGHDVALAGETLGIRPALPSTDVADIPVSVAKSGRRRSFAVISDLHFGSKYHRRDFLLDFIDRAVARGVTRILLGGDLLDGCYRHGKWELTHHGFQDQCADFIDGLPRVKGLQYWGITGNHDQTFEENGSVVHEAINAQFRAAGRTDLTLLAARGAYVRLKAKGERRGLVVELWHPLKGPAYALSYKLQKHIESYAVGCKPDLLFTGHWHQSIYFSTRGVHAFSAGTFQGGGSSFSKSLGGSPSIGGWIVDYALTADGTVRSIRPEWVAYYEREVAREIEMH
jgi:predicted phosphodiesterase